MKKIIAIQSGHLCNQILLPIILTPSVASYPSQPSVKRKTNHMGKCNLFIIGDSHIKRVKKNLIIHHLSDKNISINLRHLMVQISEEYNTTHYQPYMKTN